MVVVKWSDKVEGSGDDTDSSLCGGLYKEEKDIVPWSGTDPDAKMNCFAWSKEDNDWIVSGDQYNKEFKNLTPSQKELLQWHFRLGHMGFQHVQWSIRTGRLKVQRNSKAVAN